MDELVQWEYDVDLVLVPIGFGPVARICQIFDGQPVEILVPRKGLYDIPAQSVDIDPSTISPHWLWTLEELAERVIFQVIRFHVPLAEVHHGDITLGLQFRQIV